jgi:hypothetical protein
MANRPYSNWSKQERGEPGKVSLQLSVDEGAEEYAVRSTATVAEVILKLLEGSEAKYFDTEQGVLTANNISLRSASGADVILQEADCPRRKTVRSRKR